VTVPLTSSVPDEIGVEAQVGLHSTLLPIAVSAAGTITAVECVCMPRSHDLLTFHELSFDIVRYSRNDVMAIQNRHVARRVIPEARVHLIVSIVVASYSRLIEAVKPDLIYRCSAFTGTQKPPLRKHVFLSEAIQICGYRTKETGRDSHGRTFWLHERVKSRGLPAVEQSITDSARTGIEGYVSAQVHGETKFLSDTERADYDTRIKSSLAKYARKAAPAVEKLSAPPREAVPAFA
jgi:hypothetical protein